MSAGFVNPIGSLPRARIHDLVARADADARVTLEAAAALGRDRVSADDLFRALVATQSRRVFVDVFNRKTFAAAVETYAGAVASAMPAKDTELDPALDIRFATMTAFERERTIDVPYLFALLGDRGLLHFLPFHEAYTEGLVTRREAYCKIVDAFAFQGDLSKPSAAVAPIYVDRHGGLSEVEGALREDVGVVLLAKDPGVGRHALVEAVTLRRTGDRTLRFALGVRRLNQELFFESPAPKLYVRLESGDFSTAIELDPLERGGRPAGWTKDVTTLLEEAPARGYRLLLVGGEDEWPKLVELVPLFARLRRIVIPPPRAEDRLALWYCQLPLIVDRTSEAFRLVDVMHAFEQAGEHERSTAWWPTVYGALKRREHVDALDLQFGERAGPSFASAIASVRKGRKLAGPTAEWGERLVGSVERFAALVSIAETLYG